MAHVAKSRPDLPVRDAAQYLVSKYTGPGTLYCAAEFLENKDISLQKALTTFLFLGGEPSHVVEYQWILYDSAGLPTPISSEVIQEAVTLDFLVDPLTGNEIQDFKKKVCLYYLPGNVLNEYFHLIQTELWREADKI